MKEQAPGVTERWRDSDGAWFEHVLHPVGTSIYPNRATTAIREGRCPACEGALRPADDGWLACTGRCEPTKLQWKLVGCSCGRRE